MRHGLATWLMENGADLNLVQAILGHSTLEMTRHYTHLQNKTRRMQSWFLDELLSEKPESARENGHRGTTSWPLQTGVNRASDLH